MRKGTNLDISVMHPGCYEVLRCTDDKVYINVDGEVVECGFKE